MLHGGGGHFYLITLNRTYWLESKIRCTWDQGQVAKQQPQINWKNEKETMDSQKIYLNDKNMFYSNYFL